MEDTLQKTLWEQFKEEVYILDATQEERLYFKDLYKSQKEIDLMSKDDIYVLNTYVEQWTSEVGFKLRRYLYAKDGFLKYAYRRYKELRKSKIDKHPMWRSKGAIELVLLEVGLPIKSFSTGFKIMLGDSSKTLVQIELSFDENANIQFKQWYRVYAKTRKLTNEEIEEYWKKKQEKLKEDRKKSYLRNYIKFSLAKSYLGQLFEIQGSTYELLGMEMKNKKLPLVMACVSGKDAATEDGKTNIYNVGVAYFKKMKKVKVNKEAKGV